MLIQNANIQYYDGEEFKDIDQLVSCDVSFTNGPSRPKESQKGYYTKRIVDEIEVNFERGFNPILDRISLNNEMILRFNDGSVILEIKCTVSNKMTVRGEPTYIVFAPIVGEKIKVIPVGGIEGQYLKSIEKDTEEGIITIIDQDDVATSFPYGGGSGSARWADLIGKPDDNDAFNDWLAEFSASLAETYATQTQVQDIETWLTDLDARLINHEDDTNIHTNQEEKEYWSTKQDKLTPGENITIENDVISAHIDIPESGVQDVKVDNVSVVDEDGIANIDLTTKQDKLIAGQNITIENNVISATGGAGSGSWEDLTGEPTDNTEFNNWDRNRIAPIAAEVQDLQNSREYTLTAGQNITIDRTNPNKPVISSTSGGSSYWGDLEKSDQDQTTIEDFLQEYYATKTSLNAYQQKVDSRLITPSNDVITAINQSYGERILLGLQPEAEVGEPVSIICKNNVNHKIASPLYYHDIYCVGYRSGSTESITLSLPMINSVNQVLSSATGYFWTKDFIKTIMKGACGTWNSNYGPIPIYLYDCDLTEGDKKLYFKANYYERATSQYDSKVLTLKQNSSSLLQNEFAIGVGESDFEDIMTDITNIIW